jgi:predicted secreted protein
MAGTVMLLGTPGARAAADRDHRIVLDVPRLSEDPAGVPVQVSVEHPMEPDHHIRSIELSLPGDPVPYKGTFLFTPGNGRASLAFRMRSGTGGALRAVAECSTHGRFTETRDIKVVEGGCATPLDGGTRERPRNVQIRLPDTVRAGQAFDVRVRVNHATDPGLSFRNGTYVREAPEFFLKEMLVFVDDQKISEFRMSSAVSANPIIRFPLRVTRSGILKVVFVNSEGHRAEATQPIRI